MKSSLTTSLRKQTPINNKAIPYITAKKSNFTYMKSPLTTSLRKQTPMKIAIHMHLKSNNIYI